MSAIEVRRLRPDEWEINRAVRLAALEESPSAFGSTLAREQQFGEDVWRRRLTQYCCVVAMRTPGNGEGGQEPVGLAGGYDGESGAELVSMWLAPDARGSGAADALVGEVCRWASDAGHLTLGLWVVDGNHAAERVYARNGFVRSGRVRPVRDGEPTMKFEMIRLLPPPPDEETS